MNADKSDDLSLAKLVVSGDERALRDFFEHYAEPLYAFIHHHIDESHGDVEGIWQNTLLAAIRSLPSFKGQSRLFTWLCRIARNKIADHFRKHEVSVEVFTDLPESQLNALPINTPLPEEILLRSATRILVVQALAELPLHYRYALVARYVDNLGVDEVSRNLKRSYKATESLLARAREAFRKVYIKIESEEIDGS